MAPQETEGTPPVRFDRLDLVRWGALSDISLDLSGGTHGLHIVYGDNEAGKSTTRRAISAVLFGIPAQSVDRFRFDYKTLRLGASIRFSDGHTFVFRRRKGTRDTLLDELDAPVSEAPLRAALGGLDRETFEQEWSLDHERLREGGSALLRGEGELGQSLLAAGLGGIGVGALQSELAEEAREIFGKRGGSTVTRLLGRIEDKRRVRELHAVSEVHVEAARAKLEELLLARKSLDRERHERAEEVLRLDRVEKARPVLREHDEAARALEVMTASSPLGPDFATRCALALQAVAAAKDELREAEEEARRVASRIREIDNDPRALADETPLRLAYERARTELGGIGKRLAAAEKSVLERAALANRGFDALDRWARGPLGRRALEKAELPTQGQLDEHEAALRIDEVLREVRERVSAAEGEMDVRGGAVRELSLSKVPSASMVTQARARRDLVWALARASLEGGVVPAATLRQLTNGRPLALAYEEAVAHADAIADAMHEGATQAGKLSAALVDEGAAEARLEQARADCAEAESRAVAAHAAWAELWRPYGIQPGSPRAMRAWVESAEAVRASLTSEQHARAELAKLTLHAQKEVAPLAALLLPLDRGKVAASDVNDLLSAASARLRHADEQAQAFQTRERDLAREQARLEETRKVVLEKAQRLEDATRALDRIYEEAGTRDAEGLGRVQREDELRRTLLARREGASAKLAMVAPRGLLPLREEVEALPLDAAPLRRRAAEEARDAFGVRVNEVSQAIGAAENELAKATGSALAADDEAEVQELIAEVGEAAGDFLRVAFAAELLGQAAERYRQKHQNPIVRRTGELLRRLTGGSFSGVVIDEEESGRSVIKGVRRESEPGIGVLGMSDGVRDQLFLAIRLAALEEQLKGREPLPFVIDDILINLSDARAAATLDVLGEVATRTQVLLFTHHTRVVELAQALTGREVFVHRLAAPATVGAPLVP